MQSNERGKVEQQYSDLIDGEACVVDRVKCLDRDLEPARMQTKEPVVCEAKSCEPDDQYRIVDDGAPDQEM